MAETISLYTIVNSKTTEKVKGEYVAKVEYDVEDVQHILDDASRYGLKWTEHSYYEGYYDDYDVSYSNISPTSILVKDGELYGFIYNCVQGWTGSGHAEYTNAFLLTEANSGRRIYLREDSRDHGDTMSESSTCIELVTK